MESRILLRKAADADLPTIAKIHLQAYSAQHFTSRLPADVLVDYYGRFIGNITEILLAEHEGEVVGFAVYGRNIPTKIRAFKRERFFKILAACAKNPLAAFSKVVQRVPERLGPRSTVYPTDYLLLSIAVARKGEGIADLLIEGMTEHARNVQFAPKIGLYVNADNVPALNLYFRHDFLIREKRGNQFYMERSFVGAVRDEHDRYAA